MNTAPAAAKVHEFMTTCPVTIERGAPLVDARALMIQHDARHLPVVDGGRLVGILSARDIELHASLSRDRGGGAAVPIVAEAMTESVFTCGPDAHLHAVAHEMAEHKFGSAVIVDREQPTRVLGVFTTTDALRALAQFTAHH